jgi:hypothetical protein
MHMFFPVLLRILNWIQDKNGLRMGLNFKSYYGIRVVIDGRLVILDCELKVVDEIFCIGCFIQNNNRNSSVILDDRL